MSQTLLSLIKSFQNTSRHASRTEIIQPKESFPKSTALDPNHRRELQRRTSAVRPWDENETLDELHRRKYFPRGSRKKDVNGNNKLSISRWPKVLQAVVEGGADLCISSFGSALFYLQRNLIDQVPDDFIIKGKRGSGAKQVNKYRTSFVANLIHDLEQAQEVQTIRKAKGMQLIFAKFDSKRSLWAAAAHATGILDALGFVGKDCIEIRILSTNNIRLSD